MALLLLALSTEMTLTIGPIDAPAQALAHSAGVTISPEATSAEAMDRLDKDGSWRLIVVGSDGVTLEGLLCLNSKRTGFCL